MIHSRQEFCRQEACQSEPTSTVWDEERLQSTEEMIQFLDTLTTALAQLRYSEKDRFAVRLALEEAIVNAVKHGHRGDPSKQVRVRYHLEADYLLAEVEDQGPGFDPQQVPDPLDPDNLERSSGRGLLLMRHYLNWIRYNQRGNCVTLCKHRTPAR